MANNNEILTYVYNIFGEVPMVVSTAASGEVHTSGLRFMVTNAASLQAEIIYGGTGIHQEALPSLIIPSSVTPNEKPKKFIGVDFKRWQQKMFFYLTTLNLVKYLSRVFPIINPVRQNVTTFGHWRLGSTVTSYGETLSLTVW